MPTGTKDQYNAEGEYIGTYDFDAKKWVSGVSNSSVGNTGDSTGSSSESSPVDYGYPDPGGGQEIIDAGIAAIIESSKEGAQHILDQLNIGREDQEKFFAAADAKLTPFVEHGLISQEELGSMLGLPGHEPYDLEKLKQTPGYQFIFTESIEGVLQAALGTKLSSGTRDAVQDRAAGLASQVYQSRVDDLQEEAQRGATAADTFGRVAAQFGANSANLTSTAVQSLGNLFSNQGAQLATLFGTQYQTLYGTQFSAMEQTARELQLLDAQLLRDQGASAADLALARGEASASPWSSASQQLQTGAGYALGGGFGTPSQSSAGFSVPSTTGTAYSPGFDFGPRSGGKPLFLSGAGNK